MSKTKGCAMAKIFSKTKKAALYFMGVISGIGVVAASISGASDSTVPYEFKDGQVISADTLNDLFGRIKMANEGFASASDLAGTWSCTTYDLSGQSPTNGMPNTQFALNTDLNLQTITQTWTFSSNGQTLSMDKLQLGGIADNNNGGCAGQSAFSYKVSIIAPYLALTGNQGCTNGNGYVLAVKRTSPYKFVAPLKQTVITCTAVNQPPNPPSDLTAQLGAGSATLNWTDNGGGTASFSVLKKVNGAYTEIGTTNSSTVTYTDATGAAGDMYRIKSVNSNGASLASTAALAK
jgi:hypothetical protein